MRRTLLVVAVAMALAAILGFFTPSLSLAQEGRLKAGFRDMTWGQSLVQGMTRDHEENSTTVYDRATDKLSIGSAALSTIKYAFFKGRFYGVKITTKPGEADALLAVLRESWGNGTQDNPYLKKWVWWEGDTAAGYAINEFTHVGEMNIFNRKTLHEVQAADAALAAKGKKDL